MYAGIDASWITPDKPMPLEVSLAMRGTESFDFVPFGGATSVHLSSSWPHPSFGGAFLPDAKSEQISATGFSANWLVDGLASSADSDMDQCVTGHNCKSLPDQQALSVRFIEPVNIYSLSNRAIKYAFLFVELIFAAFFLFELIKRLRIHPAQYLLVGFGIALFFMLLIRLSEHLTFVLAYAIAASACTVVIAAYLSSVLAGVLRGVGFGCGLALLFAALYVLLQSEDDALVLGSSLLFVLLAGAMFVTRKLDWYALQGRFAQN
jgi:inner membrane protein